MRAWRWLLLIVMVVGGVWLCGHSAEAANPWMGQAEASRPAPLPQLTRPLVLDGDLGEWPVSIPACSKADLEENASAWQGPSDAGLEVFLGWTKEGLGVAVRVADEAVANTADPSEYFMQDCVEIRMDGRPGSKLGSFPYSAGAFALVLAPPTATEPPTAWAAYIDKGQLPGLKLGGKRTATGYIVEALVPWSSFPGFTPKAGARLGFGFRLDDLDPGEAQVRMIPGGPLMGEENLPANFTKWVLTGPLTSPSPSELLPLLVTSFVPVLAHDPVEVAVALGRPTTTLVASMQVAVTSPDGALVFEKKADFARLPEPWSEVRRANLVWQPQVTAPGDYTVRITLTDARGQTVGTLTRQALYLGGYLDLTLERFAKADVASLAPRDPFRAAQYLAAAACRERVTRAIEIRDLYGAKRAAAELEARLGLLEQGTPVPSDAGRLELLNLAATPQAQVVLEFPDGDPSLTGVTFYWGAIPLASAMVYQYSSAAEALANLRPKRERGLETWEKTTVEGHPALARQVGFSTITFPGNQVDPGTHVLVVCNDEPDSPLVAVNLQDLSYVRAEGVVILPECPTVTRQAVETWSRRTKTPVLSLTQAASRSVVLLAGPPTDAGVSARYGGRTIVLAGRNTAFTGLSVAVGTRVIETSSPSAQVARRVIALVAAGQPVAPVQVDELRRLLVAEASPFGEAPGPTEGIFSGDVHMHTFYSDGSLSPAGLMLLAMSDYHDFAVMTDHETLDGALVARQLLSRHGFAFDQIVGQEITNQWSHFNGYPLTRVVSPNQSAEQIIAAVHAQPGAVIQWNHPWQESEYSIAHFWEGFRGTGLDAWEHVLGPWYTRQQESGGPTVITGSTDTHDNTFFPPERTIVLASSSHGDAVAGAVRAHQAVALSPYDGRWLYGEATPLGRVWRALAQGDGLKEAKAQRLREMLAQADLVGLLRDSSPRVVAPQ